MKKKKKQVLVWVSEKIELEKWVMKIEFELRELGNEKWEMSDEKTKQGLNLYLNRVADCIWGVFRLFC